MTAAQLALWLTLAAPAPDFYGVPKLEVSYAPIVDYWADVNLVARPLAHAVIHEESKFNPNAKAREWKQDKHGIWHPTEKVISEGFAMITKDPEDRADLVSKAGMTISEFNPWNSSDSLRVGMAFMGRLLHRFGYQLRPAVAGYNCGMFGAAEWWEGRRRLPSETREYLRRVIG